MSRLSRRAVLHGCACCAALGAARPLAAADVPPLSLREVAEGVWMHTSWLHIEGQAVPSNGAVVLGQDGVLLIDTAWTNEQTTELLERIEGLAPRGPLTLLVTHAHQDRMGGIEAVRRRSRTILAHVETARWAAQTGLGTVETTWDGTSHVLSAGGRRVELLYPGPAHTRDNIVAFVEDVRLLFGGCMIRGLAARDLGNVQDADRCHWPQATAMVSERFAALARLVIPGHGEPGDAGLLRHTADLAAAGARSAGCG